MIERDDVVIDSKDRSGKTPLSIAVRQGHEAVVRLLIEQGIDVDSRDDKGQTPLSSAAKYGHEATARLLVELGAKIDSRDMEGKTPLSGAAERGKEVPVRLLVELGAEIESRDNKERTPLLLAARGGHEAIVRLLVELGAKIDSRDNNGRTPLSWVSSRGWKAEIRWKFVNLEDHVEQSPFSSTTDGEHKAMVRLLIELGAEIDSRDNLGRTPLSLTAERGYEAVARLLIELGAKINLRDNEGRTPLSWAARCGREELVSWLIKQDNVDVESKDYSGRTAFNYAVKRVSEGCGAKSMVKLLRREMLRRKNQLRGTYWKLGWDPQNSLYTYIIYQHEPTLSTHLIQTLLPLRPNSQLVSPYPSYLSQLPYSILTNPLSSDPHQPPSFNTRDNILLSNGSHEL